MNLPGANETSRMDGHDHLHHFHGGLHVRHHKQMACRQPAVETALPGRLIVPMLQHAGEPAIPCVEPGQTVLRGELVGRPPDDLPSDQRCAPVHAPTSGTVEGLVTHGMSHASGQTGPCVVLQADGHDQWGPLESLDDWRVADPQKLLDMIRAAGVTGLGGAVFPTGEKVADARARSVHTLIINGAECEPFIACDEMLMRQQPDRVVLGAMILQRMVGADRVVIAIEDQMGAVGQALQAVVATANHAALNLVRVPSLYPEGGERQLIQVLSGREVPQGQPPSALGMLCVNVGTAAAVAAAVVDGKPLVERYVTVTGRGVAEPRNFIARLGTPLSILIEAAGGYTPEAARLVIGGPMMGYTVGSDAEPVVKSTNCILVLAKDDIAPAQVEMPCIRCGECARVCPAGLLPQSLQLFIRNGQWSQAAEYGTDACIECGCCDQVCPSHIPLTQWFRFGRFELRRQAGEARLAEQAKQRHEARQARQEAEQEQRGERLAKRKAKLRDAAEQRRQVEASIARAAHRKQAGQDPDES